LGYTTLALVDANGVYGAPRFYKAARAAGIRPLVGAEVTITSDPALLPILNKTKRPLFPQPPPRLTLLVASRIGYQNLCTLLTDGALGRPKGEIAVTFDQIEAH